MEDDETELRNPFPSPPSHYTRYTSHNLKLLALLRERAPDPRSANQYEVLADQTDLPEWPLIQLEKPRIDWILEEPEPYYEVFGDKWFIKEKIPSLADLGGNQLYPADPSVDRRPALQAILRSILVTYSGLTSSLLEPPPTVLSDTPPTWQRQVEWINMLSQNLMAAANDLRPVQARANLELMMKRQLDLRQEETINMHQRCDALESRLNELRTSLQQLSGSDAEVSISPSNVVSNDTKFSRAIISPNDIKNDAVLWAEEIG